jgi:hypothetical protein
MQFPLDLLCKSHSSSLIQCDAFANNDVCRSPRDLGHYEVLEIMKPDGTFGSLGGRASGRQMDIQSVGPCGSFDFVDATKPFEKSS